MPGNCAVATCKNTWRTEAAKGLSFHRFPRDERLAKLWLSRCCRKDPVNVKTACICSEHFEAGQFMRDFRSELMGDAVKPRHILKEGAIPTVKLPYKKSSAKQPGSTGEVRKRRGSSVVLLHDVLVDTAEVSGRSKSIAIEPSESNSNSAGCQSCVSLQTECDCLRKQLEQQMNSHAAEVNRLQASIQFWKDAARKKSLFYPRQVEHHLKCNLALDKSNTTA